MHCTYTGMLSVITEANTHDHCAQFQVINFLIPSDIASFRLKMLQRHVITRVFGNITHIYWARVPKVTFAIHVVNPKISD